MFIHSPALFLSNHTESDRSLKNYTTSQIFFRFVAVLAVRIYLETLMLKQMCNACGQSNAALSVSLPQGKQN